MAKKPYEIFQEQEAIRAEREFQEISQSTYLSPNKLWQITDDNFYKWANIHYYPSLINFFKENLNRFEEWQRTWMFDTERILKYGITNCLESKDDKKNPYKYIIEQESYHGKSRFISQENLEGITEFGGPYFTYRYKKIEGFISYLDWIRIQNEIPHPKIRNNRLLTFDSSTSPDTQHTIIRIIDNFTLLKMGGIKVPLIRMGLLNTKVIEFVNLSNFIFQGKIITGNKELVIKNSFLNNLTIVDCELALVTLYKCKIPNLKIINSKIMQWNLIECEITGDISDSELTRINVLNGYFNAPIRNCKLYECNINHSGINHGLLEGFKILKTAYNNQGDDKMSLDYYMKEKEYERKQVFGLYKYNMRQSTNKLKRSKFSFKGLGYYCLAIFKHQEILLKYFFKTLNYQYWGYGRKPFFVIRNSFFVILIFMMIYLIQFSGIYFQNFSPNNILESFKVSLSSFSTLGFFPSEVNELNETLIILESMIGALNIGAFIGSLANQKY